MSHEFESGFYLREPAWHKKGTVIPTEVKTWQEAAKLAGLEWEVLEAPLTTEIGSETVKVPSHKLLYRSTDGQQLGVVRRTWTPLQNEKLLEWFQPFLDEGAVTFDAVGSLRKGKCIWVCTKVNIPAADVGDGDIILPYLNVANFHDGGAWTGRFSTIREVCWNTVSWAISEAEQRKALIKVKHTKNIEKAVLAVRDTIDIARRTFEITVEDYRRMKRQRLGIGGLEHFVRRVFDKDEDQKTPRAFELIRANFLGEKREDGTVAPGSDIAGQTVWGAYNAVTEWVDHYQGRSEENRLNSVWFGNGKAITHRAYELSKQLVS